MTETKTVATTDAFIGRHGDGWRLYVVGWTAPYLRQKLDQHGEAFPTREPDLADLERFMWGLDAPYQRRLTLSGDVELQAKGRSAIVLAEWLDGLVGAAQ
jgi:hypothetical protein